MGAGRRSQNSERGFTLIELLVITIIISILAAISIPIFFRQRDKGYVAQSQSALANARLLAESYYVGDGDGSYSELDADILIENEGLQLADTVTILVFPEDQSYCIAALNFGLPVTHEWQTAMVMSGSGTATPDGDCT